MTERKGKDTKTIRRRMRKSDKKEDTFSSRGECFCFLKPFSLRRNSSASPQCGREDKKHAIKMIEKCMPKIGNFFLSVHFLFWFCRLQILRDGRMTGKGKLDFIQKTMSDDLGVTLFEKQ